MTYYGFISRTAGKGQYFDLKSNIWLFTGKSQNIGFFALFEENMNRSGIDDQNNDNIDDKTQDILAENVEDDDDTNNEAKYLTLSQNIGLLMQFC